MSVSMRKGFFLRFCSVTLSIFSVAIISFFWLEKFPHDVSVTIPVDRGIIPTVLAEDDEDEDEDEEEEEYEDEDDDREEAKTTVKEKKQTVTRYVTERVEQVVDVTPKEFLRDTDGDRLVDGVDPHPSIHESEFFTDIDQDGVPNALDRYHDEDDFAFFDDSDDNSNGILDTYEFH